MIERPLPSAKAEVVTEWFDDEVVLFEPTLARTVHLDPIATAVWTWLDGRTPCGELLEELETLGVGDAAAWLDNVLGSLDRAGVLAGA